MKATESRVQDFLSSNKTRFVIPVYQRNYDWTQSQCTQLINDIFEIGADPECKTHFIGGIVFVHDDVFLSSSIKELIIIDGQQRLTTITLIYIALYQLAKQLNNFHLADEINETYLINKYAPEKDKLKLKPTENNEVALRNLLIEENDGFFKEYSRIIDNFNYFKGRITEDNYQFVIEGLAKLMFVEISLSLTTDDPQKIFESLNSTGLDLSQADLIRNYILMGLSSSDQNKIYSSYWQPIEQLARDEKTKKNKVSDYIRDYLTLENKKIPNKGKVYLEFKKKFPISSIDDLEKSLKPIKKLARQYNKLINPKNESDLDIREQIENINNLEINVAFPFLMKVYDDYESGILSKADFLEILELVQSFVWRRFILGLVTNALNKIFMNLYDKVDKENYLYSIQKSLVERSGSQRFPKDQEVIDALKFKDVYNINTKNRVYLLERLENFKCTEKVKIKDQAEITTEHIFPQNPDPKWKVNLGAEEYKEIKENYLNTISNLTLSGNNGKLGNKPFIEKRDLANFGYSSSKLWLNQYLSKLDQWNVTELEQRFQIISERFLEIWRYPQIEISSDHIEGEENIFDADDPTHKKLEYVIFFDQKIEIKQTSKLYAEVMKQLLEISPETFFTTTLGEEIGLTKNPEEKKLRQPVQINDMYFIESNLDNANKFDRIKKALLECGFEDELMIKYA